MTQSEDTMLQAPQRTGKGNVGAFIAAIGTSDPFELFACDN